MDVFGFGKKSRNALLRESVNTCMYIFFYRIKCQLPRYPGDNFKTLHEGEGSSCHCFFYQQRRQLKGKTNEEES